MVVRSSQRRSSSGAGTVHPPTLAGSLTGGGGGELCHAVSGLAMSYRPVIAGHHRVLPAESALRKVILSGGMIPTPRRFLSLLRSHVAQLMISSTGQDKIILSYLLVLRSPTRKYLDASITRQAATVSCGSGVFRPIMSLSLPEREAEMAMAFSRKAIWSPGDPRLIESAISLLPLPGMVIAPHVRVQSTGQGTLLVLVKPLFICLSKSFLSNSGKKTLSSCHAMQTSNLTDL